MNLHIINIIIKREYLNRVKKKSFLWITFLGPVFFAAMCVLPSIIMLATKEEAKKIAVVDESGIVMPYLKNTKTIEYHQYANTNPDSLKSSLDSIGMDALLVVSPLDSVKKSVNVDSYSKKPLGVDMSSSIEDKVNDAVEGYRVKSYQIAGLDKIMNDVKSDISLTSYTLDESGKETLSASEVYMIISMVMAMIIYMFIAMFGGMVMSSVIEEKTSRVVEVLVSSVKATELMFGKIIGIALVALTQFFLWIVLTAAIVGVVGSLWGFDKIQQSANAGDPTTQMAQSMGVSQEQMDATGMNTASLTDLTSKATAKTDSSAVVSDSTSVQGNGNEMTAVITTLKGLNYSEMIAMFIVYFILGYLLYASLFAAIGSAVESENDTQQLQIPITIPLLIGFFIAFYAFKSPDSGIVFWGSMIPFTSPIVMLARIPFGVPAWQLALSIGLLILTFWFCAYISAKIYKIGILMYGKKSTYKDLWKWLKQK
jgi:ABC-2 type transport system permease protein